jgi:hypothetical protein
MSNFQFLNKYQIRNIKHQPFDWSLRVALRSPGDSNGQANSNDQNSKQFGILNLEFVIGH